MDFVKHISANLQKIIKYQNREGYNCSMNYSGMIPRKLFLNKHSDNTPVFFTGLTKNAPSIDPEIQPKLCKQCNVILTSNGSSGELCINCLEKSRNPEATDKMDRKRARNSSQIHTQDPGSTEPAPKRRALLPSPSKPSISNTSQQNDLEQGAHSRNNIIDKGSRNSLPTPNRKQAEFKSPGDVSQRLGTNSNFHPYSKNTNENKKRASEPSDRILLTTPSPQNERFIHSESHKTPEANFQPPRLSKWSSPEPGPSDKPSDRTLLTTPSLQNERFIHSESRKTPEANFQPPRLSKWSSPEPGPSDELSREIWRLYHENKQTEKIFHGKMLLRDQLHDILRTRFPNCGLYVVGSSMTGLGVKSSDIDMCLMLTDSEIDQTKEAIKILYIVKYLFGKYRFLFGVQVIPAKVPIIKFTDSVSGIEVDLNINNAIGIRNTQLLSSYARMDKRFPPLVVLVKMWARSHNINDAKFNSLSSYSFVLMVIHFLQYRCKPAVLPSLQLLQPDKYQLHTNVRDLKLHEDLPNFVSKNKQNLGELFVDFLKYFANEFNYETDVMSVRLGRVISRESVKHTFSPKNKEAHWKYICIEEPFDLTNTARSVFNEKVFRQIQHTFEESWKRIKDTFDLLCVLG